MRALEILGFVEFHSGEMTSDRNHAFAKAPKSQNPKTL
jgi:hypothetical protein